MKLPDQYAWLQDFPNKPQTIVKALELFGTAEVVGRGSNHTILEWRDELIKAGVKIEGYSDDDIPWCGLFAAIVTLRRRGNSLEVVKDPLWARNWAKYGEKSPKASLGDVLVFVRNGGGHVAFYVGEDTNYYHCIGGNQSNKVCITRVAKDRCIAVRRPPYKIAPEGCKPIHLASTGVISKNEA